MQADAEAKTFFFEGRGAGYFEETELPCSNGKYRYMPLRSGAHYRLHLALKSSGPQRCHHIVDGKKRFFTVLSCPSYGQLELAEFE
jgi:hypothetical protein